jgi:hypothetical protein
MGHRHPVGHDGGDAQACYLPGVGAATRHQWMHEDKARRDNGVAERAHSGAVACAATRYQCSATRWVDSARRGSMTNRQCGQPNVGHD